MQKTIKMTAKVLSAFEKSQRNADFMSVESRFSAWRPISHTPQMDEISFTSDGREPTQSEISSFETYLASVLGYPCRLVYVAPEKAAASANFASPQSYPRRTLNPNVIPGLADKGAAARTLGIATKLELAMKKGEAFVYAKDVKTLCDAFMNSEALCASFGAIVGKDEWRDLTEAARRYFSAQTKDKKAYFLDFSTSYEKFKENYDGFFELDDDYDALVALFFRGRKRAFAAAVTKAVREGKKIAVFSAGDENFSSCNELVRSLTDSVVFGHFYGASVCLVKDAVRDELSNATIRLDGKLAETILPDSPKSREISLDEKTLNLIMEEVVDTACEVFDVTKKMIFSSSRIRSVVNPRRAACIYFRDRLGLSFARIGRFFKKDHSTVIHLTGGYAEIFKKGELYQKFKKQCDFLVAQKI